MMRRIIAWSLQLRLLMVAAAAVLIFFGVTELRKIPLDVLPEFTLPRVEIQTEALGLSASEVEAMLTVPLEADMLNGAPWVKQIRSESIPGLSSIVLEFEPGTDLLVARQMTHERMTEIFALPGVSKPPVMLQPISSTSRFLKIGVTSSSRSLIELSVLARWTIVPRLMGVSGVANVSIWGNRDKQLQVHVDPEKLHATGVNLHQVIETAGNALWASPLTFLNASTPGTGGWIETPNQRLGIQHLQPIATPVDLSKVTVEGTYLSLNDVASVVEDHQPLIGDAVVDDAAALMLVVEKLPWASTLEVTRGVEEAVEALELGLPGVRMDTTLFRPATYLELAREDLSRTMLVAFALAVVALLGLLFHWRLALISSLAVLLSAMGAVAVLYLSSVNLNMMLIAGLMVALGALIDDAIIDVQNAARRLRERRKGDSSAAQLILEAALAMRSPILYATLIALLAVAPVYLLEGVWGALTQPIAVAYATALLVSVLVALTVTPALCLLLLRDAPLPDRESPIVHALRSGFDGLLSRSTAAGTGVVTAVGAVGAVLLAVFIAFPASEQTLLPNFRERDVLVEMEGPPGTSDTEMARIASRASRELRAIPGVRNVSAHVGRAIMSDRVTDVDSSELWVSIDRTADYDATLAAIQETVGGYPGLDIDVDTYLTERLRDEAEIDDEFVVRVYGEDMDTLRRKAEEVKGVLAGIHGVVDPWVEYESEHPTLEIRVDLERSKAYGLKPGDVRRASTTLLSGIQVGSLFEEQKVFDVVVWAKPDLRESLSDIENLLIDTPPRPGQVLGDQVRLAEVADLRIVSSPTVIHREAVARHLDVNSGLRGRDAVSVAAEADERIRRSVDFPLEFRAEVMGGYSERIAAANRVRAFAIAAAIVTFLLLQAAFRSWGLAGLFLLTLPVAGLGGALLGGLAGGGPLSLGAILGFLAVLALATRNGCTLIWHYRQLEKELGEATSPELVLRGTRERFVPIAMSAIVTALAFLPFALSGGAAGHEILQPMAVVVLGGLVTATLVNLLVVPSLYLRFGAATEPAILVEEEPPRLVA
jgi:CzcA family heavy metal efflux pump